MCLPQPGLEPQSHEWESITLSTTLPKQTTIDRQHEPNFFSSKYIHQSLQSFGRLGHAILLSKLEYYGLHDNANKFLKNYLSDRDQHVQLGYFKSQYENISCGIPQGSVWVLFYSILSLMIFHRPKKIDFVMHADDTTLVSTLETFGSTCNVKEIERNINIEIFKVST